MSEQVIVRWRPDSHCAWDTAKAPENMTIDFAFRLVANYALQGQEAEIWVGGRRVWPRMEAQSEGLPQSRKAEAGRALILVLGWLLAIAAFSLWLQSRPVTMWPDYYPQIEEKP